jgi:gamma-glutamylcyclotransferase (GGCT)/AIG2-like uncharacterized protein YtfP
VIIRHYFAYGSNMNVDRVRARAMPFETVEGGRLPDYELLFDKVGAEHAGRAHANIAPRAGSRVEGVLYRLPDPAAIITMDRFERTPLNYSRDVVRIETAEGTCHAWTYFANPGVRRSGYRPERAYLAHLLAGAPFLSVDYLARLRAVEAADA